MKIPLVVLFCSSFFFPVFDFAQTHPISTNIGATHGPSSPTGTLGTINNTNTPDRPIFITGKVILSDGSPVTESVAIESVCGSRKRVETYTDSHGNFNFELKKKPSTMAVQSADASGDDNFSHSNDPFQYQNCELQGVLPGFTSDIIQLAASMSSSIEAQSTDVGRITLHPFGKGEASVLSATSLAAPNSAKKALDKARDLEKKNKIPQAEQSLQKAVQIYPKYAAAWAELGNLQYVSHDNANAQHSFEQALAADPKYARPYLGLASLAIESANWNAVVDYSSKLLAMNSSYPAAWLLHAIGQYNLQDIKGAEASVLSGLKMDPEHRVPRLEHLLAMILIGKKDYVQAADHMRAFLKYSTTPSEVAEGQKQLADIEHRSAQANLATTPAVTPAK